jgi:predicted anti-sigma-YlaC factor YlaD
MNILMLSCRKATELMEKKLHAGIGPLENIQLFMHTQMCDGCRAYQKQNRFLDVILRKKSATPENEVMQKSLPEEVKYRIVKELEKL